MPASYSLAPDVESGVATCSGAFGCLEAVAASVIALVLWVGLATGLLFTSRANVGAALAALETEFEAVVAERDALAAFATRVEKLPTAGVTTTTDTGGGGVVSAESRPGGMAKLRDAYRETVMAVDHYDRDYGESFPVNFAGEFGDGVAGAVVANDSLSPPIKRAVLASTERSRGQRRQYLETLNRERDRLAAAGDDIERAATYCGELDDDRLRLCSFEGLQRRYERLDAERQSLDATLTDRQETLQEGVTFGWQRRDSESVYRYLYRDVDATYPVLADGTRVLKRIDALDHRLITALTAKT